jgi:hypothetical protein
MRHDSIDTTMKYYVSQNTDALAARLLAAVSKSTPVSDGVVEVTPKVTSEE